MILQKVLNVLCGPAFTSDKISTSKLKKQFADVVPAPFGLGTIQRRSQEF